jgi:hypothetical protein
MFMQKILLEPPPVTLQVTPVIVQGELPLIGLLKGPETLLDRVVGGFGDDEETATRFAVRWAWDHRRVAMSQNDAATHMGIPASHLCNILSGKKYLPPHKINAYEWIVGNRAVSQTIERFRAIREQEQTRQLAALIAEQLTRAA